MAKYNMADIIQGRLEEIDKQLAVAVRKQQWARAEHLRKEKKRLEGTGDET